MNAQRPRVLAVDDEPGILRLITLELSSQGFEVIGARGPDEALALLDDWRPEIAVLDLMLPGRSGVELMAELRARCPIPVILLTAKDSEADKIRGLDSGADDYIAKPFSPEELTARVRAVMRRRPAPTPADRVFRNGSVEIDLTRRLVRRDGKIVQLSRTEWMLLQQLAQHPGKTMGNVELLHKVWGAAYCNDLQYLRVWVSRIRRKLEDDPSNPRLIRTFPGVGYTLSTGDEADEPEADDAEDVPADAGVA